MRAFKSPLEAAIPSGSSARLFGYLAIASCLYYMLSAALLLGKDEIFFFLQRGLHISRRYLSAGKIVLSKYPSDDSLFTPEVLCLDFFFLALGSAIFVSLFHRFRAGK